MIRPSKNSIEGTTSPTACFRCVRFGHNTFRQNHNRYSTPLAIYIETWYNNCATQFNILTDRHTFCVKMYALSSLPVCRSELCRSRTGLHFSCAATAAHFLYCKVISTQKALQVNHFIDIINMYAVEQIGSNSMKRFLTILLTIVTLFTIAGCNKNQNNAILKFSGIWEIDNTELTQVLTDEESEKVKQYLSSATSLDFVPNCIFYENVSITLDGQVYAISCDNCPTFWIVGSDDYYRMSEEEKAYIESLFIKYVGYFAVPRDTKAYAPAYAFQI